MVDHSSPRSNLRIEQAARTRARIMDAITTLVRERGDYEFTMPEIATAAGVSLRTLYRYFPTRQHVIDAVASIADQAAASNLPTAAFDLRNLAQWLEQAWGNLLDHEAFIRSQHSGPGGAAVRRARIPAFRAITTTLLRQEVPDIAPGCIDDIVDTTLLLVSSSALFECIDVLDIPVERAARLAADAINSAIEHARTRKSAHP